MDDQIKWNNRLEYPSKETPTLKKADVNYFENWRTDCAWYAKIQMPPPENSQFDRPDLKQKSKRKYEIYRRENIGSVTSLCETVPNGYWGDFKRKPT